MYATNFKENTPILKIKEKNKDLFYYPHLPNLIPSHLNSNQMKYNLWHKNGYNNYDELKGSKITNSNLYDNSIAAGRSTNPKVSNRFKKIYDGNRSYLV